METSSAVLSLQDMYLFATELRSQNFSSLNLSAVTVSQFRHKRRVSDSEVGCTCINRWLCRLIGTGGREYLAAVRVGIASVVTWRCGVRCVHRLAPFTSFLIPPSPPDCLLAGYWRLYGPAFVPVNRSLANNDQIDQSL
ncbi:hypothetical protein BaRGS_00016282 [Batillaria attramentaria]|uniref:Uncharacterized protein n=1 Tax=Batillaria attramentaria TaxID=370345 RepID=A0ABD0KZ09_9CAEN